MHLTLEDNTDLSLKLYQENGLKKQYSKIIKIFFSMEPLPTKSQPMWLLGASPSSDWQSNPAGRTGLLASDPARSFPCLHRDPGRLQQGTGE